MRKLADSGLMPASPSEAKELELLDPYELRAKGLDERLDLHHLGRTFFHLNQRRGFKSNRKTDRGDNEAGKIVSATARLDQAMLASGARTYGEFLHKRRASADNQKEIPPVRTRLTLALRSDDEKPIEGYDFYPDRRHLEAEFNSLWEAQQKHHPDVLTDALYSELFETVFFQRPLKQPEVGLCLYTDERRLPKAHPLAQRRTLYETVNALRVSTEGKPQRPLTRDERDHVIHCLDNRKPTKKPGSMSVTFETLAKTLKLPAGSRFSHHTAARDGLACDPVRASMIHPTRFGGTWSELTYDQQWDVIKRVQQVESDTQHEDLLTWIAESFALDEARAVAVSTAPLPEGYGRLGETATRRVLAELEKEVVPYSEAVARCGWHHSDHRTGEILDELPYYGEVLDRHVIPGTGSPNDDEITRYGRISNPTVHIGLNQLRRVVNRIIARHGKPDEIVVELARDLKLSDDRKRELEKRNKSNRADALRRSQQLQELGQPDTGANRALLRLYEELGPAIGPRCCPYTGEPISLTMVFDGSCDIDHILPYSRTLDDSIANRTLCKREANRLKGNRTPWEAWGETPAWEAIGNNLKNLPTHKAWRFAPDAMTRFEGDRSFLDRALVDTQYLSRIARAYLDSLFTEGGHVWVVPGRLTEMLRRHWGLNSLLSDRKDGAGQAKNRTDHRHHAIDAAVVGACDRSLVNRISKAAARNEQDGASAEDVTRETAPPWPDYRSDLADRLSGLIVSHRSDHGRVDPVARASGFDQTAGQLHNDTAYGLRGGDTVVRRVGLLTLGQSDIEQTGKGRTVVDPDLRRNLQKVTRGKSGKDFEHALQAFSAAEGPYKGIRRVRVEETLTKTARIEVQDTGGRPYKAYKGDSNHCFEIWRLPNGKAASQVVTTFDAHQGIEKKPHPAAKRMLRLFKRDMVAIDGEDGRVICYVQKFDPKNGVFLVPHHEANADARARDKQSTFKLLQMSAGSAVKAGIRRVLVDEIGRVRDSRSHSPHTRPNTTPRE